MKGNVIGFDTDTNTGAISGHDGKRYDFSTQDWHTHSSPRHGDLVDFTADGGHATQIYLVEPEYVAPSFGQFLFSPSGRISRKQFWLKWALPYYVILILLIALTAAAAAGGSAGGAAVLGIITLLFVLITLWPSIAVLVKRIHDRNKSGWMALILYVPVVLSDVIGAAVGPQNAASMILNVVVLVVGIWFFVEFGCMRGTIGHNQYGADPVPRA
jgi:uncharacterized membrane protein YhaH (DUF805 family)